MITIETLRTTGMVLGGLGSGILLGAAVGKFVGSTSADALQALGLAIYALAVLLLLRSLASL